MSMGTDDLAEARAARMARERDELESRHDVEAALFEVTTRTPNYADIFQLARAKGSCTVAEDGRTVGVVSYVPGHYSVIRQFDTSQEG